MAKQSNKKKTPTPRQLKEKALDRLWQEIIVGKSDRLCELVDNSGNKCNKPVSCGHHIVPKGRCKYLRWKLHNGIAVCLGCHYGVHHSTLSWKYLTGIQNAIGLEEYKGLQKESIKLGKFTMKDLEDIKESLTI